MRQQLFPTEQSEKTSDDYLTPAWVFDTLGLTFDLDVASPPWETHVPAARKFTKADDGLSQPWEGRVWMNPPFSESRAWVLRFMEHGHGIALLPFGRSRWLIDLWAAVPAITIPQRLFAFDGGPVFVQCFFAAYGEACVDALNRIGPVR
jgi:hypothetical protein